MSSQQSSLTELTLAVVVTRSKWDNSLSFELENKRCESLCEYFTKAYEHFKVKVQVALMLRHSVKIQLYFNGTFVENGEFRQVEHYLSYCTTPAWIHSSSDIRECYDSCLFEVYREIANTLPTGVVEDLYELSVQISDFDEDLD